MSIRFIILILLLTLVVSAGYSAEGTAKAINARDFGAKGDGVTDDTAAIQSTIDAAAKAGGVANLPAGNYLITKSLVIPGNVTLAGEAAHWENLHTTIIVKENGFPAIRLTAFWAAVKGLHISYPNNDDVSKPVKYPPAIQVEAGHATVENINLSLAWDGISTPEGGANAGQSQFRNITGFIHNVGIRLHGPVDVVRIEDVHWFIPHVADPFKGGSPYYATNRVGFEIGSVDGLLMTRCFMIFGKTFFRQLPKHASLGLHVSQCWIEHMQNGFVIEGICGLVLSDINILLDRPNGVGIQLTGPSLYYNCAISNTQIRYAPGGEGPALIYAPTEPHFRNWLGLTNCQFDTPEKGPSIKIGPKAQRAKIEGCHITGKPAILIEKGASELMIRGNFLKGTIQDRTSSDTKKVIDDNLDIQ